MRNYPDDFKITAVERLRVIWDEASSKIGDNCHAADFLFLQVRVICRLLLMLYYCIPMELLFLV